MEEAEDGWAQKDAISDLACAMLFLTVRENEMQKHHALCAFVSFEWWLKLTQVRLLKDLYPH